MAVLTVIINLILYIAESNSVKLTGPCPISDPSHILPEMPNSLEPMIILRAMPFSLASSNIFKFPEINSTHAPELDVKFLRDYRLLKNFLYITHRYMQPPVSVDSELKDTNIDCKVPMNTTVYTEEENITELKCLASANESVKFWFDGDFVIIWSCLSYLKKGHEEAVLVMQRPQPVNNGNTLKEAIKEFRNISTKYLTSALVDSIDWETSVEKRATYTMKNDLFLCPSIDRESTERLSLFLGGYLFLIIILLVVFFGNCGNIFENMGKRNKVAPYLI